MNFPPTKTSLKALGLLMSAALVAGACGSDPQTAEPGAAAPLATQAADDSASAAEDSSAPAEESPQAGSTEVLATISGGQIDFGALEGQDALLWFWAPW